MLLTLPGNPPLALDLDLTPTQARCLMAIAELSASGTVSLRGLASFLGCHVPNVQRLLNALAGKGYVTWEPVKARTLRLAKPLVWKELQ